MSNEEDFFHIENVVKGDLASFSFLVDKYKNQSYTLAFRIVKNREDAEEISQDSFLKVFRSLKKFKKQSSFSTWLYRIVYNTAISHVRKMKLETTPLGDDNMEMQIDQIDQSFQNLVKEDQALYLNYALEKLSEKEVVIIHLYYSHEKDMKEIAEIMNLSHVNVRAILSRARNKLFVSLQKVLKGDVHDIL